jgi:hypothetical protein
VRLQGRAQPDVELYIPLPATSYAAVAEILQILPDQVESQAAVVALLQMYCLLYRIETDKEPNAASYLVTNAVFILGFFTLALLLGEHSTSHN